MTRKDKYIGIIKYINENLQDSIMYIRNGFSELLVDEACEAEGIKCSQSERFMFGKKIEEEFSNGSI